MPAITSRRYDSRACWPTLGLLLPFVLLVSSSNCLAQDSTVARFSQKPLSYFIGASLAENLSKASIYAFDNSAICGVFQNGSKRSPNFFGGIGVPLGEWQLLGKLQYSDLSTSFTTPADVTSSTPRAYRRSDGALVPINRDRYFDASLGALTISALASHKLLGGISVCAGPFVGDVIRHTYQETEKISGPSDAVYAENSLSRREIGSGSLAVNGVQAGLEFGVSYDLPFQPSLTLRPAFTAMLPLTTISDRSTSAWRVFPVGLSLSIVYSKPEPELPKEPISPLVLANWDSLVNAVPENKPDAAKPHTVLQVAIKAYGVTDAGEEIEEPVLSVERMHVTEVYPMLHYVFFDDGETQIPARYHQRTSESVRQFDEKTLFTANALEIHHNVLDILGKRLKELPNTSITILGARSEHSAGDSVSGNSVAKGRAEAVAKYLHEVWGISNERLKLKSRGLPEVASDDRNAYGEAENRRVEIIPSSADLTAPLWTERIEKIATPPHLDFAPQITASNDVEIKSAMIVVRQRDRVLQSFDALTSGSAGEYIWTLANESMPDNRDSLTYTLTVVDSKGDTASASGVIHLRQETHDRTLHATDTSLDKELERFSLILFDYSSSQVEKKQSDRIISEIAKSIDASSQVTLTGHTDKTGDDAFNEKLAEMRVNRAAEMLDAKLAKLGKDKTGMLIESHGSRDLLFDNSLPEGRVLSRTVRALIQNDISK